MAAGRTMLFGAREVVTYIDADGYVSPAVVLSHDGKDKHGVEKYTIAAIFLGKIGKYQAFGYRNIDQAEEDGGGDVIIPVRKSDEQRAKWNERLEAIAAFAAGGAGPQAAGTKADIKQTGPSRFEIVGTTKWFSTRAKAEAWVAKNG